MAVRKVPGGFKYGNTGKVSKTKAGAVKLRNKNEKPETKKK